MNILQRIAQALQGGTRGVNTGSHARKTPLMGMHACTLRVVIPIRLPYNGYRYRVDMHVVKRRGIF